MGKTLPKIFLIAIALALIVPFSYAMPSGTSITLMPAKASIAHPIHIITQSNATKVVVFDESKNPYRDHTKLSSFIDYLNNTLNRTVIINTQPISMSIVAAADIIIIPNPSAPYSEEEIEALHRFVENGGALLIMGEVADYFNPSYIENITAPYGIHRLDVAVQDDTDNSYKSYTPIIHVFNTNDSVVQMLTENVTDIYYNSGTALNVTSPAVVVATGDNDTYVTYGKYNTTALPEPKGYDVVTMAYYVYPNEYAGRVFAIGSSGRLRDNYGYYDHNAPFVQNLVSRLAEANKNRVPAMIVDTYVSSDTVAYLDNVTLKVKLESVGGEPVSNVTLNIDVPSGLQVIEGNTTYAIGDLAPGETFEVELVLKAVYTMQGEIVINATAANLEPITQTVKINVIPALDIKAIAKPTALNINERNDFQLEVNLTNVAMHVIHNVGITLTLPQGISGNDHATIDEIPINTTARVLFNLTVSEAGVYSIKVTVESSDAIPYPYTLTVAFIATEKPNLIVLDLGHTNRPPADQVTQFVSYLKTVGTVIINNGTLTSDLLKATKLLILAYPKYGLTESEINAIIDYVNNGGNLIITGNAARYSSEDGQKAINAIAMHYGVYFMDVTVMDDTNNSYRPYTPIIHVFNTNDPVGAYIFNGVKYIYYQAGTALTITGNAVPLAFGDEDTYLVDKDGNVLNNVTGTDIVTMAYRRGTGKVFFIGSTGRFRDKYDYYSTNAPFVQNLISRMLATPKITMNLKVNATSVTVGDKVELTITISNTGLDIASVEVGIIADEGLKILNASQPIANATINAPYVFKAVLQPGETKSYKILFNATKAGDRKIRVYYAIGGEIAEAGEVEISVSSGAAQGTSAAKTIAISLGILAIIAIIIAYRRYMKKQKA